MTNYDVIKSLLNRIFGKEKNIMGCDIGLLHGHMEVTLLDEFPNLTILGIDPLGAYVTYKIPPMDDADFKTRFNKAREIIFLARDENKNEQWTRDELSKFGCGIIMIAIQELNERRDLWARFSLLQMDSDDAVSHIKDKFDYIYIDGDHHYEQVKRDILNYLPFVKDDGILCGDDYHPLEFYPEPRSRECLGPEVKRAVDEIIPEAIIEEAGTWWAYKKDIKW